MKKLFIIALLHSICMMAFADTAAGKASLSGIVTDDIDKAPLVGVSIFFPELKEGTITNEKGEYNITGLPAVNTTIQVSYVGHQTRNHHFVDHGIGLFHHEVHLTDLPQVNIGRDVLLQVRLRR